MVLPRIATLKERAAAALAEFLRLESAGGVLLLGMANRRSAVLADLESSGAIRIVGAMYNIETGLLEFLG